MASVASVVNRRGLLLGSAAGAASLALGWARPAAACGSGVDYDEEEVLDLASAAGAPPRELAHFVVEGTNATADHRFSVSPDGELLCFADREVGEFRVAGGASPTRRLAAPAGGTATFTANGRSIFLQLRQDGPYDQILLANPHSGERERWGDFFDAEPLALAPGGLVIASRRVDEQAGGLSWVTGAERVIELARTPEVPKHTVVRGSRVAYFLGADAYALDLDEPSRAPEVLGRLSKPATGSAWSATGLVATNPDGAWLMGPGRAPRLLVKEANLRPPLAHRGTIVLGSERRIWFWGANPKAIVAPHASFHFTGPIAGSSDFILCRGPSVYRYRVGTGQLERLGMGRPGMKLRGAAMFGKNLLTWSSRTWGRTDGGCSPSELPKSFLVE